MADEKHLELARRGARAWNRFRDENIDVAPDLSGAALAGADLAQADLSSTNLFGADLSRASLDGANFSHANLMYANLSGSSLENADFRQANLFACDLSRAKLSRSRFSGAHAAGARFRGADLRDANLFVADISRADLGEADLRGANFFGSLLIGSNLSAADCRGADLSGADLSFTLLVETDLTRATLSDCRIQGISADGIVIAQAKQADLVLTAETEPAIAIDGVSAGLFISRVISGKAPPVDERQVLAGRAVLILGEYPHERRAFLNAIREELRKDGYIPVLFGLESERAGEFREAAVDLARLSRFVIADLTAMDRLPDILAGVVAETPALVQPLVAGSASPEVTVAIGELAARANFLQLFQTDSFAEMIMALSVKVIPFLESRLREEP